MVEACVGMTGRGQNVEQPANLVGRRDAVWPTERDTVRCTVVECKSKVRYCGLILVYCVH